MRLAEMALIGGLLYSIYAYVQGRSIEQTKADLMTVPEFTTGIIAQAPEWFNQIGMQQPFQQAGEWSAEWISELQNRNN